MMEDSVVRAVCECDRVGAGLVRIDAGAVGVSVRDAMEEERKMLRVLAGESNSGRGGVGGLSH